MNRYNIQNLEEVEYKYGKRTKVLKEKRVKEGKEIYKDWDKAKKEIRDRIQ